MLNTSKLKYFQILLIVIPEKWQEASQCSSSLNKAVEKHFCFISAAVLKSELAPFCLKLFLWTQKTGSSSGLTLFKPHFTLPVNIVGSLPSPQQLETTYLNLLLFSYPSTALSGFKFLCWHEKSKQFFCYPCVLSCQPKAIMLEWEYKRNLKEGI